MTSQPLDGRIAKLLDHEQVSLTFQEVVGLTLVFVFAKSRSVVEVLFRRGVRMFRL